MSDDFRLTGPHAADPRSWIDAALAEFEPSPAPMAMIRVKGRAMIVRRRVTRVSVVTIGLALIVLLGVTRPAALMGLLGKVPPPATRHHGAARPVLVNPVPGSYPAQGLVQQGAAYSPDGTAVARGDIHGNVYVYGISQHRLLATLPLTGPAGWAETQVVALAYTPDGRTLVAAYWGGRIVLWDTGSWHRRAAITFTNPGPDKYGIAISPDGSALAAAGADGTLRLWSLAGPASATSFRPPGPWVVPDLNQPPVNPVFSRDGRELLSMRGNGLDLWRLRGTGATFSKRIGNAGGWSLALSPDGTVAAVGGTGGTGLWEVASGRRIATLIDPPLPPQGPNHVDSGPAGIYGLAFSPDGRRLAAGDNDNRLRLWSLSTRAVIADLRPPAGESGNGIMWTAFSADGRIVVAALGDLRIRVWDISGVR